MFDLKVKRTQESLVNTINGSGLPISMTVFMLQSLLASAREEEYRQIAQQEEQERNQLKQEEELKQAAVSIEQ